jgi:DNA-binding response OmpR family regulator
LNILVVEDNYLVAEMLRTAVEDAGFNVIGPAKNVEDSTRLAAGTRLDGALLDIQLGGAQSFPVARLLKSSGVPFIFVTGYDASIVPIDLKDSPFMGKPVFVGEIARIALANFAPTRAAGEAAIPTADAATARMAQLRDRIAGTEARIVTQRRRVDRLRFQGMDPSEVEMASDLLEQMKTSVEHMRAKLGQLEDPSASSSELDGPIDDEIIDLDDPRSVRAWSDRLGIPTALLLKIGAEVGASARTILRAFNRQVRTGGVPRKSSL